MHVSSSVNDLDEVIQQYHAALDVFVRGNPEPMKALFSHADDVILANPFGPAVRGWQTASARLEDASSQFSDGELSGTIAWQATLRPTWPRSTRWNTGRSAWAAAR